jgi:hypothetical protein
MMYEMVNDMSSIAFVSGQKQPVLEKHSTDGMLFANAAIGFTALAWLGEQANIILTARLHLYALAIDLSFKSLALRSGATPGECKKAGHRISEMIRLIESRGVVLPERLKQRLNDDEWFTKMVNVRYPIMIPNPSLREMVFFHKNYPEMIAQILEIPCACPLRYAEGGAIGEIKAQVRTLKGAPGIA